MDLPDSRRLRVVEHAESTGGHHRGESCCEPVAPLRWLVITDQAIRIERKGFLGAGGRLDVLPRPSLIGAKMESGVAPVFGKGGATTMIFSGMGMTIKAEMVDPGDAKKIMELLGFA